MRNSLITSVLLLIMVLLQFGCANGQNNKSKDKIMEYKYTNALINESSPYLLQHAHNPVNWYAWNSKTLELAKKENKPILISIGYSSCHWCHVMEHQSFENKEVAKIMNDNFICIKVDREEHPDVDQIYMNAVQIITGSGGWPLNCFALPDGRPFYGGTYFPKKQWTSLLNQISNLYNNDFDKVMEFAESIENGIKNTETIEKIQLQGEFSDNDLDKILNNWVNHLDDEDGGPDRTPKFPLPNNYSFLMRYANYNNDKIINEHVKLTLDKMLNGGIYDQLGGGFARYSTDKVWKVPHFEKMLYDNAQLVSLYSEAYKNYGNLEYKRIVIETLGFIKREMTNADALFYSALDADSEGEEGKFYVWKKSELESVLGSDAVVFEDYYQVNDIGYWEHDNYILMRNEDTKRIAKKFDLSIEELEGNILKSKEKLMAERSNRVRPGLDDKSLLSWNSLMISAYCDAYSAFGTQEYKETAINAMNFILKNMQKSDGSYWHTYKNGNSKINAYLDDYASLINALMRLYEVGAGNQYLAEANEITAFVISKFYDGKSGMFFFTSVDDEVIVIRKKEVYDNVIPASNSIMARNLFKLSRYFDNEDYKTFSMQMLNNIHDKFRNNGSSLSNWGLLMMDFIEPNMEVIICGKNATKMLPDLQKLYLPNVIWAIDTKENNEYDLLKNRFVEDKTLIYICVNNSCQLPLDNVEEASSSLLGLSLK